MQYRNIFIFISALLMSGSLVGYAQGVILENNIPSVAPANNTVTSYPKIKNYNITKFNFVRTKVLDQAVTSLAPNTYYRQSTDYIDGLGRKLQTVQRKAHKDGYDIVQQYLYDSIGRSVYNYLPYAADVAVSHGKFHNNVMTEIKEFYNDASLYEMPYVKNVFEKSPNSPVIATAGPGRDWLESELSNGTNKNNTEQNVYGFRKNRSIVDNSQWVISLKSMSNVMPRYTLADNSALGTVPSLSGIYDDKALIYKVTLPPGKNSKIVEFYDMNGNKVADATYLKEPQNSNSSTSFDAVEDYVYTFYVYDNLNRLRCVIPPTVARPTLSGPSYDVTYTWPTITTIQLTDLCYEYEYDASNRLIKKKVPGKQQEHFVYDSRDRMILSQDGNLRASGIWAVAIYDKYDRPVATGHYTSTLDRNALQNQWRTYFNNPSTAQGTIFEYLVNYKQTGLDLTSIAGVELFTHNYYDEYPIVNNNTFAYDANYVAVTVPEYGVTPVLNPVTAGKLTETAVRSFDETGSGIQDWSTTRMYYDIHNRLLQSQTINQFAEVDYNSFIYYFNGEIWKSISKSTNPLAQAIDGATDVIDAFTVEKTFHSNIARGGAGNALVWKVEQKINQFAAVDLMEYHHDHLGREVLKNTENLMQQYQYNVRGFLTKIEAKNENNNNGFRHIFSEELSYNNGFAQKLFDGNISGIKWKKSGDNSPWEAYGYTYDPMNRLLHAEYRKEDVGQWKKDRTDYSETNISYDYNGNIKTLKRMGVELGNSVPTLIDDLQYTYTNHTNKLVAVHDLIPTSITNGLPDFKNHVNTATEYTYDANGNMLTDANKNIADIAYNHWNKPKHIFDADGNNIQYVYDANGVLLRKIVSDYDANLAQPIEARYDYLNGFVFKNDTLQYYMHADGRIRPMVNGNNTTSLAYDYFVKDHLGNIRTTVTTQEPITALYLAEHEVVSANIEESLFDNIDKVRSANPLTGADDYYAARLNAEEADRTIGTSILLKVMPSDVFSIKADAFYNKEFVDNEVSNEDVLDRLMNTLLNGSSHTGVAVGESGASYDVVQQMFNSGEFADALSNIQISNEDPDQPKAYLNIVVLQEDLQVNVEKSKRIQVNGSSVNNWGSVACAACPDRTTTVSIDDGGYLLVFVSNNTIGKDVWFDNVNIQHQRGYVVEENHYYPFGLTLASTAAGTTPQPYKFQGKELEKSLSLELNDFGARMYDPQLGRWNVVDPLAEKYPSMSPYVAMANNPVMFIDPDGRDPIFAKNFWGNVNLIGDDGQNTEQSYLVRGSVKKDVKASTKRGEKYTGSLVENENVYNIPTGAVMEDVISSVNETRKSKRENGGHVNIGDLKATRWDEGPEAFEFIDENGNKGAKAQIFLFKINGVNMTPTDASNLKFWWHVHPNTTIGEFSLGDSNPSPADKNAHRELFDKKHLGNSFVIGTKTNTVTFYNHKRSLITVKYSDFKKMGGK